MHAIHSGAIAPGSTAPQSVNGDPERDEAETTAGTALGFRDYETERTNSLATTPAEQAALTIEGQQYATEFLARVDAGMAQPAELSLMVSWLNGGHLDGFCRAIQKRLESGK